MLQLEVEGTKFDAMEIGNRRQMGNSIQNFRTRICRILNN
jgi:hypothetical protein